MNDAKIAIKLTQLATELAISTKRSLEICTREIEESYHLFLSSEKK